MDVAPKSDSDDVIVCEEADEEVEEHIDPRAALTESPIFGGMPQELLKMIIETCARRDMATLRRTCQSFKCFAPPQKFYSGQIALMQHRFYLVEDAGQPEQLSFLKGGDDSIEGLNVMVGTADLSSLWMSCPLSEYFLTCAGNTNFTAKSLVLMSISTVDPDDDRVYTPEAREEMLEHQRRRERQLRQAVRLDPVNPPIQSPSRRVNRGCRNMSNNRAYAYGVISAPEEECRNTPNLLNLMRRPRQDETRDDAIAAGMVPRPHIVNLNFAGQLEPIDNGDIARPRRNFLRMLRHEEHLVQNPHLQHPLALNDGVRQALTEEVDENRLRFDHFPFIDEDYEWMEQYYIQAENIINERYNSYDQGRGGLQDYGEVNYLYGQLRNLDHVDYPYTREQLRNYCFLVHGEYVQLDPPYPGPPTVEWIEQRIEMERRILEHLLNVARSDPPRYAADPNKKPLYHLSSQLLDDKIEAFIRLIVKWQPETIELWDDVFPELAHRIIDDCPSRVTKMHIASWNKELDILRKMPLTDVNIGHIPPSVNGVEEFINRLIEEWLFTKRKDMGRWKLGHAGYILIADRLFKRIPDGKITNRGFGEFVIKRDFRELVVVMGLDSIRFEDLETATSFNNFTDRVFNHYNEPDPDFILDDYSDDYVDDNEDEDEDDGEEQS